MAKQAEKSTKKEAGTTVKKTKDVQAAAAVKNANEPAKKRRGSSANGKAAAQRAGRYVSTQIAALSAGLAVQSRGW